MGEVERELETVEIANSTLEIARENLKLNTFSYNEGKLPFWMYCLRGDLVTSLHERGFGELPV